MESSSVLLKGIECERYPGKGGNNNNLNWWHEGNVNDDQLTQKENTKKLRELREKMIHTKKNKDNPL